MKIIRGNNLYLQKKDIFFLSRFADNLIIAKLFQIFGESIFTINKSNEREFVKFEDSELAELFLGLDYIVDYDELKNNSLHEIIKKIEKVNVKNMELSDRFDGMDMQQQISNLGMIEEMEKNNHKIRSLREYIVDVQNKTNIELPEEIQKEESEKTSKAKINVLD